MIPLETLASSAMTPSLPLIIVPLSKPVAALQLPEFIWPPLVPLLLSVCLSPAPLLSLGASYSWSGRSGARVAVATCPIPITGWITLGLCVPVTSNSPQFVHESHTAAFFPLCPFQKSFLLKRTILPFLYPVHLHLSLCLFPESARSGSWL